MTTSSHEAGWESVPEGVNIPGACMTDERRTRGWEFSTRLPSDGSSSRVECREYLPTGHSDRGGDYSVSALSEAGRQLIEVLVTREGSKVGAEKVLAEVKTELAKVGL